MRTIEIDNELILVEVSKDAVNFELGNNLLYGSTLFYKINNAKYSGTDVIKGDFEIIGLIETPNVDFDFELKDSWVEKYKPNYNDTDSWMEYYDYINDNFYSINVDVNDMYEGLTKSFRTRIQRKIQDNGFYLVNPISINGQTFSNEHKNEWEQAEERTIKGNLLLIKKLK